MVESTRVKSSTLYSIRGADTSSAYWVLKRPCGGIDSPAGKTFEKSYFFLPFFALALVLFLALLFVLLFAADFPAVFSAGEPPKTLSQPLTNFLEAPV